MGRTADVVIIGGGIIGLSIAYYLALKKAGRIVLFEKGQLGEGSTRRCAGGIRTQFSTEINIRFLLEGGQAFMRSLRITMRFLERFLKWKGSSSPMVLAGMDFSMALFDTFSRTQKARVVLVSSRVSPQEAGLFGFDYAPTVDRAVADLARSYPEAKVAIFPAGGLVVPMHKSA